ncbi:MAG: undecaprenyldiphospho-muramoylpentapeptide beta-N-acetylglucosaminyltransferase [Ignavibacteria bacterium RBG_13_36_8]|nr:MAG: undecaprenyldiphospho-muramoylpentapeptide beta-N-acetylglucosaminyltransferase [Ignavibacteria bacterium RBG_13_36_8]
MNGTSSIYRFVFAAGGTGGHIYPAVAVAQKLKELKPESKILFVGTKNKLESKVIPQLGFDFKSVWISGFSRKMNVNNLLFPVKLFVSTIQSLILCMKFKPRVAIGAGAYVAGPVVWGASVLGAKVILLEQNSYPGITNRLLEKRANQIHLTFEDSKKYFRLKDKLMITGNPVRINLKHIEKNDALKKFGLNTSKKNLLILGGSGGALSINNAIAENISRLTDAGIQLIWQTGEVYYDMFCKYQSEDVKIFPFIEDMSAAFSACDLLLARAGATTIAEASQLGIPVVFIPSTNVAANHQYMNAKSLQEADACILIEDKNLQTELMEKVHSIIYSEEKLRELKENIKKLSKPDAAKVVAENAIMLAEKE